MVEKIQAVNKIYMPSAYKSYGDPETDSYLEQNEGNQIYGSGSREVFTTDSVARLRTGTYLDQRNLALMNSVPANSLAKKRIMKALSMFKLKVVRGEDNEEYSLSPRQAQALLCLETLLWKIGLDRLNAGRAFMYYDKIDNIFVRVAPNKISRHGLKNPNAFGYYKPNPRDARIELDRKNTAYFEIIGEEPDQLTALTPCSAMLNILTARGAAFSNSLQSMSKILKLKGADVAAADQFSKDLVKRYGGVRNIQHIVPMALPDGLDVELDDAGSGSLELPFIEAYTQGIVDIASCYNIHPILLYFMENTTYNNVREARVDFYKGTILPEMNKICQDATLAFVNIFNMDSNVRIVPEYSHIPEFAPDIKELAGVGLQATGRPQLTTNEFRDIYYNLPPVEGGDVLVGLDNIPTAPIAEAQEQTDLEQKMLLNRMTEYRTNTEASDTLVKKELYHLNKMYDRFVDSTALKRATRLIDSGNYDSSEQAIEDLTRMVHIDFYEALGFKQFKFVAHTYGDFCSAECIRRQGQVFSVNKEMLHGCKCLVYPVDNASSLYITEGDV